MDGDGYQDDPTILDPDPIWRRVPDDHWIYDENQGRARPSSDAFRDDPDGSPMSVFLGNETPAVADILVGHDGYKVASVTAGFARELKQRIARDPILPEWPSHALVVGDKRRQGRDKKFAKASVWVAGAAPTPIEIAQRRST